MLVQAHVDVAKACWILSNVVGSSFGNTQDESDIALLRYHLGLLAIWMERQQVLPPHHSAIDSQDATIWLVYPPFNPDLVHLLGTSAPTIAPFHLLPIGDARGVFFYNRIFANACVNTEDAATDRVNLPCLLSIVRGSNDYQISMHIASQSELVNVVVNPEKDRTKQRGLSWDDVTWNANSNKLYVQLPHGFTLTLNLEERELRSLLKLIEYTRRMDKSFVLPEDETLIFSTQLAEAQYTDSSNPHAFPSERVRGCHLCVHEKTQSTSHGAFRRRSYHGHRVLLVTPTTSRTLGAVSLDFGEAAPFLYDIPDTGAGSQASSLQLHSGNHEQRQRTHLVFRERTQWAGLLNIMHGMRVAEDEMMVAKLAVRDFAVQVVETSSGLSGPGLDVLHNLSWQAVAVVNKDKREPLTVMSDSLRVVIQHAAGAFTDRMNLSKSYPNNRFVAIADPSRSRTVPYASSGHQRTNYTALAKSTKRRDHDPRRASSIPLRVREARRSSVRTRKQNNDTQLHL